jgi:hypothetical protein
VAYFNERSTDLLRQIRRKDLTEQDTQFLRGQLHEQEVFLRDFLTDESSNF